MVVAYIAANPLTVAHFSLTIGSGILAYQLVAERVDRAVERSDALKIFAKSVVTGYVMFMACFLPNATFICLCIITIASKIFPKVQEKKIPELSHFMRDMIEDTRPKKKCTYVGYDQYIRELEIVLNGVERNNAVLVGPAGVGKSAIFETIAWKIAHHKFPENSPFANKRLIWVDLGVIMVNTKYIGVLEGEVQKIIRLAEADPDVIFVVDEIHKLEQAGATMSGKALTIGNQLKNALARPGLKILGATTAAEYSAISNDPPLARRFARVDVNEPNDDGCYQMIKHRVDQGCYDRYAPLQVTEEALRKIVAASKPKPGFFPDKAAKMLESVCARAYTNRRGEEPIVIDENHIEEPSARVVVQPVSQEAMVSVTQVAQVIYELANQQAGGQPR